MVYWGAVGKLVWIIEFSEERSGWRGWYSRLGLIVGGLDSYVQKLLSVFCVLGICIQGFIFLLLCFILLVVQGIRYLDQEVERVVEICLLVEELKFQILFCKVSVFVSGVRGIF